MNVVKNGPAKGTPAAGKFWSSLTLGSTAIR